MKEIKHTDSELFARLFEQYKEPFARFANSFVHDMVVAESLFVDALVDYWQRREQLPENTNVPFAPSSQLGTTITKNADTSFVFGAVLRI